MISKMTDEAALDMLMTSEFEDNYTPTELKNMLLKYRYFYRILHSRMERVKSDAEFENQKLREMVSDKDSKIYQLQVNCASKEDTINSMKSRKLTLKERITGKIILKDEN